MHSHLVDYFPEFDGKQLKRLFMYIEIAKIKEKPTLIDQTKSFSLYCNTFLKFYSFDVIIESFDVYKITCI